MGQKVFQDENGQMQLLSPEETIQTVKKSYECMDLMTIQEDETKWINIEDYVFENKYFLSEKIYELILFEECALLYTEFFE